MAGAGEYVFADMWPDQPHRGDAILQLMRATKACLDLVSPWDDSMQDCAVAVKLQLMEALCLMEAELPRTDLAPMFHVLMHVPDCSYRWYNHSTRCALTRFICSMHSYCNNAHRRCHRNAPRNWWCYFGERCMGTLIRHIHNRDLAGENILTAYVRQRVLLATPPHIVENLARNLHTRGMRLPARTLLRVAEVVEGRTVNAAGLFNVVVSESRRNHRSLAFSELDAGLVEAATRLAFGAGAAQPHPGFDTSAPVVALIWGVAINGRRYRQGDHVFYLPYVQPRPNGGNALRPEGALASRRVATINCFYVFTLSTGKTTLILDVRDRPVLSKHGNFYEVSTISGDVAERKWRGVGEGVLGQLLHCDSLTHRAKLVPHFEESARLTRMCVLPMWEAR